MSPNKAELMNVALGTEPTAGLSPPDSTPSPFSLLMARPRFTVRTQRILFYRPSTDGRLGCFLSFWSINKVAMTTQAQHFPLLRMPAESHRAKWNCFKCQRAYAFVILINSAKLPSREVVAIYTPTDV